MKIMTFLEKLYTCVTRLHITVADLRGAQGTRPPPGPNSFNFMQLLGILAKSYVGAPLGSWRPLLGEILDPPLYRISNSGQSQNIRERQPSLADLGERETCAPSPEGPDSFNFMQFLGNFGKIVYWCPPHPSGVGAKTSGKSCIRHWKLHQNKNKTVEVGRRTTKRPSMYLLFQKVFRQ